MRKSIFSDYDDGGGGPLGRLQKLDRSQDEHLENASFDNSEVDLKVPTGGNYRPRGFYDEEESGEGDLSFASGKHSDVRSSRRKKGNMFDDSMLNEEYLAAFRDEVAERGRHQKAKQRDSFQRGSIGENSFMGGNYGELQE